MNFHRDRNLIILSVLFFAIIGSLLLGCSEGSESTPVGALMTDINNENYKSGGRTLVGTFNTESNISNTTYGKELGGIPVTISKYIKSKDDYVEIDKTVTSLESEYSKYTSKFKFTGLGAGSYKITTPKTNTFKAFEGITLIEKDENASDSTTLSDLTPSFNLALNQDELNGLQIKVVSAHTGSPLDSATIKIDNKAVDVTNSEGISTANEISIGFHNIEVNCAKYEPIKGKFKVVPIPNQLPQIVGSDSLQLTMVEQEPSHKCSIVGRFLETSNAYGRITNPAIVRLYKYEFVSTDTQNISYYKLVDTLKETKTSYGIDGTNNGSFKFLDLEEGYYRVYIHKDTEGNAVFANWDYASHTCKIYNLSNYDYNNSSIDIGNYRWQPFEKASGTSSRPIAVNKEVTVYWSNIEEDTSL